MKDLGSYSDLEFDEALSCTITTALYNQPITRQAKPRAILLGGQSGAGKSALHRAFKERLDDDVIVINGDEYRASHPRFTEIRDSYGMDAPAHTAQWSGSMTEALIDAFSAERFNLIIEGTLRTSHVPLDTAALLAKRGYDISLAIIAVKPEISLISCQIRYEMMRIAGTTPRATDPKHHENIVHEIVKNLAVLEASDAFSEIELYDRAGRCRYPADDALPSAAETLEDILFGRWSAAELGHLEYLQSKLARLKTLQ